MKKIVLLVVLSLICVSVFAAGKIETPTVFDPTVTPFEGEWKTVINDFGDIFTYTFTGNRWEYLKKNINDNSNDVYLTELFNYNDKQILFTNEDGTWVNKYEFIGSYRIFMELSWTMDRVTSVSGYFTKQPYGDLVNSYYTKEKLFSDIVINENELVSIQGTWRSFNRKATYTFSGNQFTVIASGKRPVNGTIKIRDNVLYLIVTDQQHGIFHLDFLPNNKIFLNELNSYSDLWWDSL